MDQESPACNTSSTPVPPPPQSQVGTSTVLHIKEEINTDEMSVVDNNTQEVDVGDAVDEQELDDVCKTYYKILSELRSKKDMIDTFDAHKIMKSASEMKSKLEPPTKAVETEADVSHLEELHAELSTIATEMDTKPLHTLPTPEIEKAMTSQAKNMSDELKTITTDYVKTKAELVQTLSLKNPMGDLLLKNMEGIIESCEKTLQSIKNKNNIMFLMDRKQRRRVCRNEEIVGSMLVMVKAYERYVKELQRLHRNIERMNSSCVSHNVGKRELKVIKKYRKEVDDLTALYETDVQVMNQLNQTLLDVNQQCKNDSEHKIIEFLTNKINTCRDEWTVEKKTLSEQTQIEFDSLDRSVKKLEETLSQKKKELQKYRR
eukprot:TRINITY_DN11498_c0_g1_i1.p1 TRINITY_DN11498_c0_g1~~TRINITY_DN11498_c0_g1_i1.p1  ORF type:complete len:374 (-),score=93.32 TRINITY_DN11498_c0_g1_i1:595-1716(-)